VCYFGKQLLLAKPPQGIPPKNFRDEILRTIVGGCDIYASILRKEKNTASVDEICNVCSQGENSQVSSDSQSMWAQCEKYALDLWKNNTYEFLDYKIVLFVDAGAGGTSTVIPLNIRLRSGRSSDFPVYNLCRNTERRD